MKISYNELSNIEKYKVQGLSRSSLYTAKYDTQDVLIKAEKEGTYAERKDSIDDRFVQELRLLELGLDHTVKLFGWGDDFNGERFVVLEKLHDIPSQLSSDKIQEISNVVFLTARQLYLQGFNWCSALKHVMLDKHEVPKLIDFNDTNDKRNRFLEQIPHYDFVYSIIKLCRINEIDSNKIILNSVKYLVEKEYQSLENVHDPIYFAPYDKFLRRETNKDNPDCGKLVVANRLCTDRAKVIDNVLQKYFNTHKTLLDIGCNTGWFCLHYQLNGIDTTGIDFDGGKIEFNKMLKDIFASNANFIEADVTIKYIQDMKQYDIVLALSVLHLYFIRYNKVTTEYWIKLFTEICNKAKHIFIYEIPPLVLPKLGINDFYAMCDFTKKVGKFKSVNIIGHSIESNRPIIFCER